MTAPTERHDLAAANPFANPWCLPFGLPDFAAITTHDIREAVDAGLRDERRGWESIATGTTDPDVANTLVALESGGALVDRALAVFHTLTSSCADDELRSLEAELAPRFAAHDDALYLDRRIYQRLLALEAAHAGQLDAETTWLLAEYLKDFRSAGVALDDAQQDVLRDLNARITTLETQFSQAVVTGMDDAALSVSEAELAGLDAETRAALARAATERGRSGHLLTVQLPTQQALLAELTDPGTRRRLFTASVERGTGTHPSSDTRAVVLELARLRAQRARLLGHEHHAAYVAQDSTAGATGAINAMLARLAPPAVANARAEAAELDTDDEAPLAAGDWQHRAEALRQQRYEIDDGVLRPYLELDRVLTDGVFHAAEVLFGITLHEREDLAGYAPGVRVWQVDDEDGAALGLFVGDYYTREGKRGGAWMHNLVDQSRLLGYHAVVVNNLNITPPTSGEPTLLTWDEVITAFHEFGHALHGLLSDVRYPSLSGANVPRDFVEFPSQVYEVWASHPAIITRYARHHRTGEPLAPELAARLREAGAYGQGFATTEYLGAAIVDQAWHQLGPDDVPTDADDVLGFERAALEDAGAHLELVPPRYRSTYFNHVFGGGYDAGYYSYIWSEVLDADTVAWLRTDMARDGDEGLNRAAGRRLRDELLARGNSRDPLVSYREMRGRDADIAPLLERRGLRAG